MSTRNFSPPTDDGRAFEPPIALSPTSYLVLGLVARQGRATPYDLKRAISHSIGNFWSFSHAQLYEEPARLAAAGLLQEEREEEGRRRRTFTITALGRRALAAWLADPSSELAEIRDLGLLKLFFAGLGRRADVVRLAQEQLRLHQAKLAEYEAIDHMLADHESEAYPRATLHMGLLYERASVAFWQAIADDPPASPHFAAAEGTTEKGQAEQG